jgi:hypothetical protein
MNVIFEMHLESISVKVHIYPFLAFIAGKDMSVINSKQLQNSFWQ